MEVLLKTGLGAPAQIGEIALKTGVMIGLTVTVRVAVAIHIPVFGIKVYVPEAVLLTVAGLHVPVIPLLETGFKTGFGAPAQIGAIALKTGVIIGLTVTVRIAVVAHCPGFGIKV